VSRPLAPGALHQRVAEDGQDEVAAVGVSFNRAATRIEALVRSHQSLLANASHELRSPLARLKMAVQMLEDAGPAQRPALRREIDTNIAELDALVEEVLLAGRLDATTALERAKAWTSWACWPKKPPASAPRCKATTCNCRPTSGLLRRALRNLLENAKRYGGDAIHASVESRGGQVLVCVCDRGPGVPSAYRERIFEAFFRLPGHAEREGGVGLGLSLVRQIAERHGGRVRCEPREGGGSCFVLELPAV
jgi:two-component system sensor histidine kinase RstB